MADVTVRGWLLNRPDYGGADPTTTIYYDRFSPAPAVNKTVVTGSGFSARTSSAHLSLAGSVIERSGYGYTFHFIVGALHQVGGFAAVADQVSIEASYGGATSTIFTGTGTTPPGFLLQHDETKTFTNHQGVIKFRAISDDGPVTDWLIVQLPPVLTISVVDSVNDDGWVFRLSVGTLFDADSASEAIITSATDATYFPTVTGPDGDGYYLWDATNASVPFNSELELEVWLAAADPECVSQTANDRSGAGYSNLVTITVQPYPRRPAAVAEVTGGHCAVRDMGAGVDGFGQSYPFSVAVYRETGLSAVNLSGSIFSPNRNCSLWRDLTNALFLAGEKWTLVETDPFVYETTLNQPQVIMKSEDWGATWSAVVTNMWDADDYHFAHSCQLMPAGAASIANKRGTDPLEIYAKASQDLSSWPADNAAVLVDTYSGTVKQFYITQTRDGLGKLVVSNGIDAAWESNDGGLTWADL